MKVEDLPHYIKAPEHCEYEHFLSINRDVYGNWTAAYMCYGEHHDEALPWLYINEAKTLDEVALRMNKKLERHYKLHA